MSLSLTGVNELSQPAHRRPLSLGVHVTQESVDVKNETLTRTNEMTDSVQQATPPAEVIGVAVASASVTDAFRTPEQVETTPTNAEAVLLRENKSPRHRSRPKSVVLTENLAKERVATPSTPTNDYVLSPRKLPAELDVILACGVTAKSRSLEDIINISDNLLSGQSTGSISSAGSHNSVHGSLEFIKVVWDRVLEGQLLQSLCCLITCIVVVIYV